MNADEGERLAGEMGKSGGGPPQSKTLARGPMTGEMREASWSAPALWRFGRSAGKMRDERKG